MNRINPSFWLVDVLMARNGGHQAVGHAGSCFLDNSVHYTDQWFSFGKYQMAVYFYKYSSVSFTEN